MGSSISAVFVLFLTCESSSLQKEETLADLSAPMTLSEVSDLGPPVLTASSRSFREVLQLFLDL